MIFVSVGTQLPFDRMIRVVDRWAKESGRTDVFAQIGNTDYKPENMSWSAFLKPTDFVEKVVQSDAVVAHNGMGTIITALEYGKPILVMPRLSNLMETRNKSDFCNTKFIEKYKNVVIARDETELADNLNKLQQIQLGQSISHYAPDDFIQAIRALMFN